MIDSLKPIFHPQYYNPATNPGSSRICGKKRVDGNQTILVWHAMVTRPSCSGMPWLQSGGRFAIWDQSWKLWLPLPLPANPRRTQIRKGACLAQIQTHSHQNRSLVHRHLGDPGRRRTAVSQGGTGTQILGLPVLHAAPVHFRTRPSPFPEIAPAGVHLLSSPGGVPFRPGHGHHVPVPVVARRADPVQAGPCGGVRCGKDRQAFGGNP